MQNKYSSLEYGENSPDKFLCMVEGEIILFTYNVYLSMYIILSLKDKLIVN